MTNIFDEATRKQVADFLPDLINMTLQSYYDFMKDGPDTEADDANETASGQNPKSKKKNNSKKFTEHHSAGKVALAHLELLFKLGRTAGVQTGIDEASLEAVQKGIVEANEYHRSKVPDVLGNDDESQ